MCSARSIDTDLQRVFFFFFFNNGVNFFNQLYADFFFF